MITTTGVAVPDDMAAALEKDPEALRRFSALRPNDQRDFVDWLGKAGAGSRGDRLAEVAGHVRAFEHRRLPSD